MAKIKPISMLTEHLNQRIIQVWRVLPDDPPCKILCPRKHHSMGENLAEHASLLSVNQELQDR